MYRFIADNLDLTSLKLFAVTVVTGACSLWGTVLLNINFDTMTMIVLKAGTWIAFFAGASTVAWNVIKIYYKIKDRNKPPTNEPDE